MCLVWVKSIHKYKVIKSGLSQDCLQRLLCLLISPSPWEHKCLSLTHSLLFTICRACNILGEMIIIVFGYSLLPFSQTKVSPKYLNPKKQYKSETLGKKKKEWDVGLGWLFCGGFAFCFVFGKRNTVHRRWEQSLWHLQHTECWGLLRWPDSKKEPPHPHPLKRS